MAYQTRDVLEAMRADAGVAARISCRSTAAPRPTTCSMQFQADLLGVPVRRPAVAETTALGAAYLAGLAVGYWEDTDDVASNWALDREFMPALSESERDALHRRWRKAVSRAMDWEEPRGAKE